MSQEISRRQFLKAAGGVTFLALSPIKSGLFAAEKAADWPIFTALPYIQPGNRSRLVAGAESIVIAWQTQEKAANFVVHFGADKKLTRTAMPQRTMRWSGDADDGETRFNYATTLDGLELGRRYEYRVLCNEKTLLEGYFTTRQPRGKAIRFVAFGDNSFGDISDRAIAYQAYQAKPDFVMNTGDNVYDGGLDNEYARYFFPVYNADQNGPRIGAPLLRSVPFYTVMANHDVHDKDEQKRPVADFTKNPDSLAYFTNMHLPLNGPLPPIAPPAIGDAKRLEEFKICAGARFPRMANYSFDYGDAHFLCLDSNLYVDPTNEALQNWISDDLKNTDARWKFVVYHHPAFNVGADHYAEQQMRILMPIFEAHNVDFVLNGHEHNYQRPQPLRFKPANLDGARRLNTKARLTPGLFAIDRVFDGENHTRADGVLHIVTGAGGKHLYDPEANNEPTKWTRAEDANVSYVTKFISDRHSLTLFEIEGEALAMTQIDESGQTIDKIRVTKGA